MSSSNSLISALYELTAADRKEGRVLKEEEDEKVLEEEEEDKEAASFFGPAVAHLYSSI